MRHFISLLVAMTLLSTGPGQADNTLNMNFGTFSVHGNRAKQSCSGQANLVSANGHKVSAAIHWRVGKNLFLLAKHPDVAKVKGRQKVIFVFPDGRKISFPMRQAQGQLQIPVGIGPRGISFYDALMDNPHVTVEMKAVGDEILVDLKDKTKAESGALYCREWVGG